MCSIKKHFTLFQESAKACSESICKNVLSAGDDWKIGKTKVFLKVR